MLARQRAEAAAKEAEDARKAAEANASNLEATARAQEAQEHARRTDVAAQAAANATPKVKNRGGKAISLRTDLVPTITDRKAAAGHFWKLNPTVFDTLILELATKEIANGVRDIPGITITTEHHSV